MQTMTAVSLCRTKAPCTDCSLWSRQARLQERYYANVSAWDVLRNFLEEADACSLLASVLPLAHDAWRLA